MAYMKGADAPCVITLAALTALQFTDQAQQLALFFAGQAIKPRCLPIFMGRHDRFPKRPPGIGEHKLVGAPDWAALHQPARFELVEQLRDVALRHQEIAGELLLGDPLGGTELSDHIELRITQIPAAQFVGGGTLGAPDDP